MKLVSKKYYEEDMIKAVKSIYMGSIDVFQNDDIDGDNVDKVIKGIKMMKSGANTLHSLTRIKECSLLFPIEIKEIMSLVQRDFDEWVEMYPILNDGCKELADKKINFYNESFLEESDRFFSNASEYALYVEFNNDRRFEGIRRMTQNDLEYSFSRAYIPSVLEGGIIEINERFKKIALQDCGIIVPDKMISEIIRNYYVGIESLSSYYRVDNKYALCKNCGSLMRKNKRGDIICSFGKCQKTHFMKNIKFEIGGYISNPTRILRLEIMRFVKYPSIEERCIFEKLKKKYEKKGLIDNVELYKGKDSCDISFFLNGRRQAIDFKEWENPIELAKCLSNDNFKRNNGDAECVIVIPDYLTKKANGRSNNYMVTLKSHLVGDKMKDVSVMTVAEFFKSLDKKIK